MRDRLIELIKDAFCKCNNTKTCNKSCSGYGAGRSCIEYAIADYLLANGVIVPPCYIGQDIWHITKHYDGRIEIEKGKVSMLLQKADKSWKIRITVKSSVWDFSPSEIGKRYFFSKEEAEAKLKGGEGDVI